MSKTLAAIFAGILLTVTGAQAAIAGSLLFDRGHGERFLLDKSGPLDLSIMGNILRQHGSTVTDVRSELTGEVLATADAVILSGPFDPPSTAEVEALVRFVKGGGRLAIMLHVAKPLTELIQRLGVNVSNGVIHEQHDITDDPINFRVSRLSTHPLFKGMKQFSVHGGWALMTFAPTAGVIASTSEDAWVDLDGDGKLSAVDAVQSFGVVVGGTMGQGQFLVFGDDAIFQNKFLDEDNRLLANNLAEWLRGKER